jgi:hypothetical protein
MSEFYDVLIQYGEDLIPLQVRKDGTFRDLKAKYAELFDVPINKQVWGGRIGDLGIGDDVRKILWTQNSHSWPPCALHHVY